MRSRTAAAILPVALVSTAAVAQGAAVPSYLDCALTAADGKRSSVSYRLVGTQVLQFDEQGRDYTIADFARQPCAVSETRVRCTRETRAPSLPNPVIRRLEIDRDSGAITLSASGLVYPAFDAKGTCVAGIDRATGNAPDRRF